MMANFIIMFRESVFDFLEYLQNYNKQNFIIAHMLPPSNYRISLQKNISLKTINHFNPNKKFNEKSEFTLSKALKQCQSKKSLQSLTTENAVLYSQKMLEKTFSFDSSDQFIKRILLAKGWHLLPNDFTHVRLKWVAIPKPLHFKPQPNQLINHFKDSYKLTTKLGLYNLLSNPHQQKLTDDNGKNYIQYFPRSYDLGSEFDAFYFDFTHTAVLNLMKKLMIHVEMVHQKTLYPKYKIICQRQCFKNEQQTLLQEIQRTLKNKDQIFQSSQTQDQRVVVNKVIFINLLKYWKHYFEGNNLPKNLNPLSKSLKAFSKLNPPFNNRGEHFSKESQIVFLTHSSAILFFKLYFYCIQTNPNFLNDGLSNIWIIKSNESSRGRNIFLIDDIEQVQPYKNGGNRLIQKYIENVWIMNSEDLQPQMHGQKIHKIVNKKFDIRFWVLVKSFAPFDAYIFSQGYLRLSSETYKFQSQESLQKNLKTHLTNFSLNFLPYIKNQKSTAQDSECGDDNSYLLFSDFLSFIDGQQINSCQDVENSDLFKKIVLKISHILMIASLNWRSCQSDKNSFELFGFDIILDSELQPYVLESNMSPACHERGELKRLVEEMGEGLLNILGLIKKDVPKDELLDEKQRKWIKLAQQSCHQLQNNEGKAKHYHQDLAIVGQSRSANFILRQDNMIDMVSKIAYLQRFFKSRYNNWAKKSQKLGSVSMSCQMIQVLARLVGKRKKIWHKKMIKYIKRLNKRRLVLQNIDSKNSQYQFN